MAGVLILRPSTPATALQTQVKSVEETYGIHNLHLTVARGCIAKLIANTPGGPLADDRSTGLRLG